MSAWPVGVRCRGRRRPRPLGGRRTPLDLQTLANLGEFLGGVVVIVTLLYLSLQVRQNNQALRTENYARAVDRLTAIQSKLAQDRDFAALQARGAADATQLTPLERIQFSWCMTEFLTAVEFMFHAAQERTLPEEVWNRWSQTLAWWLSLPGVQMFWRALPAPYSPSFTAYVEGVLANNPADPEWNRRFQQFLAAPASPPRSDSGTLNGQALRGQP